MQLHPEKNYSLQGENEHHKTKPTMKKLTI